MSWGGNTIARSLALVAVATGAAFVHWGIGKPLTLTLKPPRAPATPASEGANPEPPGDDAVPGDPTPTPTQEAGGDSAFDPNLLGNDIGTAEGYELWKLGATTFLDARPAKDYEAGHIAGAFLVPADGQIARRVGKLMELTGIGPGDRVVIYCEGGTCDASHLVALTLQDMGFEMIHIDTDGYPAWEAAGYETETGPDPLLGGTP